MKRNMLLTRLPLDDFRGRFISLSLLVAIFLFTILILPAMSNHKKLQAKLDTLLELEEKLNEETKEINLIKDHYTELKNQLKEIKGVFSEDISANDLLTLLTQLAEKKNVQVNNIKFESNSILKLSEKDNWALTENPFSLTLEANLINFYQYIHELEASQISFKIDNLLIQSLNDVNNPHVIIDLRITFYLRGKQQ